jgi:GWxTD domain-containing protein
VRLRAPLLDQTAGFAVTIEDLNGKPRGLLYEIMPRHTQGTARGTLTAPARQGDLGLGGPVFLWELIEGDTRLDEQRGFLLGPCEDLREQLDPDPSRTYGIFQPELTLYWEIYAPRPAAMALTLTVASAADSMPLVTESATLECPWARTGMVRQLDISRLPAGSYELALTVRRAADRSAAAAVRAAAHFQIQWDPDSWRKTQSERLDEASLLLEDLQWRRYREMEPGQQEAFLDSVWASLERRRGDAVGDLRTLFQQRVDIADARFGAAGRRGSLTDRGRVFVRFGEPDEVHKELNPRSEDLLFYFLQREIDEEGAEAGGRPKRHPMDVSAYLVWYYIHHGEPLLEDGGGQQPGESLRFIFVDEMGTGDYRMIYSNLIGGIE